MHLNYPVWITHASHAKHPQIQLSFQIADCILLEIQMELRCMAYAKLTKQLQILVNSKHNKLEIDSLCQTEKNILYYLVVIYYMYV